MGRVRQRVERLENVDPISTSTLWDAKGDLAVGSAADAASRLAVGANGTVLTADSAQTLGVKWAAATGITALTGDVTATGPGSVAATIANDSVTYAKMQNVSATDKVLGRSTAGAGDVEEIACTAAGRALIDDADAKAQRTTLAVLGTRRLAKSAAYTVVAADHGATVDCTAGPYTVSLTAAATMGDGFHIAFYNRDAGTITVDADGSEVINSPLGSGTDLKLEQYQGAILFCNGTDWSVLSWAMP